MPAGARRLAPVGAPGPSMAMGRVPGRGQNEARHVILTHPSLGLQDRIPHQFGPNHRYLTLSVCLQPTVQASRTRPTPASGYVYLLWAPAAPTTRPGPLLGPLPRTLSCHRCNDFHIVSLLDQEGRSLICLLCHCTSSAKHSAWCALSTHK